MTTNNKKERNGILQKLGAAVLGILALIASFLGFGNTNRAGTNEADIIKNVQKESDKKKDKTDSKETSKSESSEASEQKDLAKQGGSEAEVKKEQNAKTETEDKKEKVEKEEVKEKETSKDKIELDQEKEETGSDIEKEVEEDEKEVVYHLVSYLNENDEEVHVESVIHGEDAKGFKLTEPEGYDFISWDQDLTNIKEDLVVKPVLEVKTFKVQFVDHMRNVIHEEVAAFGENVELIEAATIEGYNFIEWSHTGDNIREDLVIKPKYEIMSFDVEVKDNKGNVLSKQTVDYGEVVDTDLISTPEGHHVVADDLETVIKEDTVLTVEFAKNTVDVIFKDGDTVIEKTTLEYGDNVVYPEVPEKEGHTFIAWSKNIEVVKPEVSHDIIIVSAEYKANVYEVDFMVDGILHETVKVEHGKAAQTSKEVIAPEGKDFVGWNKKVENITENTVVEAVFETKTYTVDVLDHAGNVLETKNVKHGESIDLAQSTDAPEGFHFVKWSHDGQNIKSDMKIKPVFEINEYEVTFLDDEGNVLDSKTVAHGDSVKGPEVPSKNGYDFLKWDQDLDAIKSDVTVTAVYGLQVKDVSFLDFNGKVIHTTKVEFGKSVEDTPELDKVLGYTFKGWDQSLDSVKDHLVVKPIYEEKNFKVTYKANGEVVHVETVQEGKKAPEIKAPELTGLDFVKWNGLNEQVMKDTEINAEYKAKQYKVDFVADGKVVDTQFVEHSKSAVAPSAPKKTGYTFAGWSKSLDNITADTTIEAKFEINTYEVSFDVDGEIITKTVKHGDAVTYPEPKESEGKTFIRWDKKVSSVTSDIKITAIYEAQRFNVVFKDVNGNDLKTEVVEYGNSATAPTAPAVPYMDFVKWDKDFDIVKGDLVVSPVYAKQEATLSVKTVMRDHKGNVIKGHDGNKTSTLVLDRGSKVVFEKVNGSYTGNLIVNNSEIIKLDKHTGFNIKEIDRDVISLNSVSQEIEISLYSNEYKVKFFNGHGRLLETVSTYHGGKAVPSISESQLELKGKSFVGWNVNVDFVTKDLEAHPEYEEKAYTVTFVDINDNFIDEFKVKPGTKFDLDLVPEGPEVEHKIFKRWTNTFVRPVNRDMVVKPMYENVKYNVKFYTGANTKMQPLRVMTDLFLEYGEEIPFDKVQKPITTTYIFKGWDSEHDTVTGDMHIYPILEEDPAAITMPIEYIDENGNIQVEHLRGYALDENAEVLGKLFNDHRIANGKKPLAISSKLNQAALERAAQTALHFSHDSPTGLPFNEAVKYSKYASGENIARGNIKPEDTFGQWLRSEGHNANMLSDGYRRVAYGSAGFMPEVGTAYWVQLFGSGESIEFIENEANYN